MPSYDITIQATVTKTIRVDGAESEQAAIETAHQNFSVSENGPEKYDEQCLGAGVRQPGPHALGTLRDGHAAANLRTTACTASS